MEFMRKAGRIVALAAGVLAASAGIAWAQSAPARLAGADCVDPPILHCPPSECQSIMVINQGPTVEPKTRRTFFLDCPVGYKPGDKVTFVLSLHGGGSYANWQRNYFPLMDQKDKHKLVIATPSSPYRAWNEGDDEYLKNIVDLVVGSVGKENVKAFWLVGHSQGGATSSRLICTPYFKEKVDVRISLSGGRTGSPRPTGAPSLGAGGGPQLTPQQQRQFATMLEPPKCDFSHIFTQGEYEAGPNGIPEKSAWADKYNCGPRERRPDVVDTRQGYVWDPSRQNPGTEQWGRYPKPGAAHVMVYPNCRNGMLVADVLRMKKGHTEGLEPNVVEAIVTLAESAPSGKIANSKWTPPKPPAAPAGFGIPGPRPGAAPTPGRT